MCRNNVTIAPECWVGMHFEGSRVIYVVVTLEDVVRKKYKALSPIMDERMRRCWAGIEAELLGEGGSAIVERATGMSRTTIRAGSTSASITTRQNSRSHRLPVGGRRWAAFPRGC